MKALDIYNKCIPSCINRIGEMVADILESIEKSYGQVDECALFDLRVVLNEILLNAIKHGNRGDETKLVKVYTGITSEGYALIAVEDEGSGYDYGCICSGHNPIAADHDICDCKENGRGIMIVKSLCDSVEVNARGNKITVLKKLVSLQR